MRRIVLLAALSAIVLAKPNPESYKEKEDFQYSRSSSDDGTKAGYYGAQRGNMGGNYERAHNMDVLAQHQMGGLVRQVDGELGDGAKTRTGSVFASANSRGIYGSGRYDLSNLKGRNFAEGETVGDLESHSSHTSQNSGYGSHSYSGFDSNAAYSRSHAQNSRNSGYQTSGHADQRQIDNLQAMDTSQDFGGYEHNNLAGRNTKYHTQYGSHGRSEFDQSSANLHSSSETGADSQTRYITTPVKVVLRPGGRVAIPITAPTYSISQNALSEDKNAINSDTELINHQVALKPKVKHYEASYSYRKEWEKHHEIPGEISIVVPTENPFPKNSELYEDAQSLQSSKDQFQNSHLQSAQSSHLSSGQSSHLSSAQRASTKSAASTGSRIRSGLDARHFDAQQRQLGLSSQNSGFNTQQSQLGFDSQHSQLGINTQQSQLGYNAQQSSASSDAYTNALRGGAHSSGLSSGLTNAVENIDTKPKSYHSSYSYHKSWERQGDPYIIKPVGGVYDDQASQKLIAATSNNAAYSSHQYGSHSRQAQRNSADCDNEGHLRVARSYNTDQILEQQQNKWEELSQQSQNLEDLGQQTQSLEDLGQQQQNRWDNLQELGQQTQSQWDNLQQSSQQNQWDNLQQLGQQTQNQWDNLQQLGQQTQDKFEKLEDLGQQTQRGLDQNKKLEDINQYSQKEDVLKNIEQSVSQNEKIEDFNQQSQKTDVLTNFKQQGSTENENLEDFSQHNQQADANSDIFNDQSNSQKENFVPSSQVTQKYEITNFEQQTNQDGLPEAKLHQENKHNIHNWEQTSNTPYLDQEIQSLNKQEQSNSWNLLDQNHQNQWYQSQSQNPDDFMKPISHSNNYNLNLRDQKAEHFLVPSGLHKDQELLLRLNNNHHNSNFWHMNSYNNIHDKFESNVQSNYFPISDDEKPIQSLWDKIDSIAGEIKATGSEIGDKQFLPYDGFYSHSQKEYPMQNGFNWGYIPKHPNEQLPNGNTDSVYNNIHHNLFDEQTPSTIASTFAKPVTPFKDSTRPNEKPVSTTNIEESPRTPGVQNMPSSDIGRGDIGPDDIPVDITTIESLSIPKETHIQMKPDIVIQPISMNNKDIENTNSKLAVINLSNPDNSNQIRQHKIFSTIPPIDKINTTLKNVVNIFNTPKEKPPVIVLDLNNGDMQQHETLDQSMQNTQKQNLEQLFEDFGQQQQSPWLSTDNLQMGYDQQNMEQQFEDFNQHENIQDQTSLQDFGQEQSSGTTQQGILSPFNDKEIQSSSNARFLVDSENVNEASQQLVQPNHIGVPHLGKKDENAKITQKVEDFKSPKSISDPVPLSVEKHSESPGFWKSVENKLSNAKNKVYSWFKNS